MINNKKINVIGNICEMSYVDLIVMRCYVKQLLTFGPDISPYHIYSFKKNTQEDLINAIETNSF